MEETGTVGEFVCSRDVTANYAKANLYSGWANGSNGMIWWCAFNQSHLNYPPYTADPLERELGVLESDYTEKPVAKEFRKFKETINSLPFTLTAPKIDAVCVMGSQKEFGIMLGAYVLSKQAGINITYAHESSIPESNCYIIPSMVDAIDSRILDKILERVNNGATLYMSYSNWINLYNLENVTGNILVRNNFRGTPLVCEGEKLNAEVRLELNPTKSNVRLSEEDGNPFVTEHKYGKGTVIFCTAPIEKLYGEAHTSDLPVMLKTYKIIAEKLNLSVTKTVKEIGITEHTLENDKRVIVAINYSNKPVEDTLQFNGVDCGNVYFGNIKDTKISIEPCGAAIFEIK